jgi:ABC-2 type transport system ATP-binding protein
VSIVNAKNLSKIYRVSEKQPGLAGTLKHLVQRKHREITAVNRISFSIEPGEIVGFLGPNGAGKTTTLKMLTGLIHPSGGELLVTGHKPWQRNARFLGQITLVMGNRQQLLWDLPALDSLKVNAAVYGIPEKETQRRINKLAEMLELGEELMRPLRKLSLGQRMKTELLAALLHQPAVLFLDEPTLGLDVNAQVRVRDFLADYNKQTGATMLLTSHYMGDITTLCPRVLLIHQGELFHDGSLSELTQKLAPCRQVRMELSKSHRVEDFCGYGDIHSLEGHQVQLLIPRAELSERVAALLNRFDVVDLEVSDPPIEELIGSLFLSRDKL